MITPEHQATPVVPIIEASMSDDEIIERGNRIAKDLQKKSDLMREEKIRGEISILADAANGRISQLVIDLQRASPAVCAALRDALGIN